MKKVGTVLHHNIEEEKKLNEAAAHFAGKLTNALQSWNALGLNQALRIEDMPPLDDPEKLVRKIIFYSNDVLKNLPIEEHHGLAMVKVPTGITKFIADIKAVQAFYSSQHTQLDVKNFHIYSVDWNTHTVSVIDTFSNWAKEQSYTKCTTEKQEEIFLACNQVKEIITALMEKYPDVKFIDKDLNTGAILVQSTIQDPKQSHMYIPHLYFRPLNISYIK